MTRMTLRAALALPLAALAVAPGPASVAAPGDLDPEFGSGGIAVVEHGTWERGYDTAVQADGRILVVGEAYAGTNYDGLVARFDADGSFDDSFGYRTLPGPPGGHDESALSVAVQPDGKIVVAGWTGSNRDGAVWRLLPSGAPDPTFGGGDGLATVDSSALEFLNDVAVAPDGAIVVAGGTTANGGEAVVYRLTAAGDMDGTFDTDGALGLGDDDSVGYGVAVQPDGKILLAGDIGPGGGMVVHRLTVSGATDTSYGDGDGRAESTTGGSARALVLQPDGGVVVAGDVMTSGDDDALLVRYTAAGREDTSFGSPAAARFDAGGDEHLYSVALMPDGGVVASGSTEVGAEAIVVRVTATGQPDPAFGAGGLVTLPGSIVYGEGVAVQRDGRILVAGDDDRYSPSAVVYRLLGDYRPPRPAAQRCQGKAATITGTPRKDRITGTRKRDVVVALGGDDVVKGLGGNDLVCAGSGDDKVLGGPGRDTLRGEKGRDRLVGGAGRDELVGGPQQDSVTQ